MTSSSVDVLIIGAGPTGLELAIELSYHNVNYRIVDALPEPAPGGRALAVQVRYAY